MREAELLDALSKNQGGVRVHMEHHGGSPLVVVVTQYPNAPHASGSGVTLFKAAFACAKDLMAQVNNYPSFRQSCPKVVEALEDYDRDSESLQQMSARLSRLG